MYLLRQNIVIRGALTVVEWSVRAKYLGKFEKGAVTEHDHFQGVIWVEQELSTNQMNKMRQWCKKFVKNRKGGGVSLTSAKKITSLVKYCQKDSFLSRIFYKSQF